MNDKNNRINIKLKAWWQFILRVTAIIIVSLILAQIRIRVDLTEDKRYTLSEPTLDILDDIRNDIYIQVFLDGDMPVPLKRLKRSVVELLDEFRLASRHHIDYEFINPAESGDANQRDAFFRSLYDKGLMPVNVQANDEEGGKSQKYIFPGMIINYNGIEVPVNFLKNNQTVSPEQNILHSTEGLEYEMIQTISTITSDSVYKVAFLEGHGELSEVEVGDITIHLAKYFTVDRGIPDGQPGILERYSAVVVAKPVNEFSEADKLVIDQYIMNGGKVLWLVDEININADSLVNGETVGIYKPLNIEDQLFRYGARINPELVQDMDCAERSFAVSTGAEQRQIIQLPWIYSPRLHPSEKHPVTRNINKVKGEYVNTLDTVGLDPAIKKTILLTTSLNTRTIMPPLLIRLREAEMLPDEAAFNRSNIPVAVLLEGVFTSAFRNRMTGNLVQNTNFRLKTESNPTKMIVIADGDIIRNEVQRTGTSESSLPLGQDRLSGEMYGNRDFLVNCMNWLTDDNGLMELRSREMKLRLLDKLRVKNEKLMWQIINLAGPVFIIILAGILYGFLRRKKYTGS